MIIFNRKTNEREGVPPSADAISSREPNFQVRFLNSPFFIAGTLIGFFSEELHFFREQKQSSRYWWKNDRYWDTKYYLSYF